MHAGGLSWRLAIMRASTGSNAMNEDTQTWPILATVWASKSDASDGERVRAEAVGGSVTARFQVYSTTLTRTITVKDRVQCDGRTYNITGVKDVGTRHEGLEVTAVARAETPSV